MPLLIPYVWSDLHTAHEPGGEVWVGVRTAGTELPERAERIRAALDAAGARRVDAVVHPDAETLALHDPAFVSWFRSAWETWAAAGLAADQDRIVPYLFPLPEFVGQGPVHTPTSVAALTGRFVYDTMTLIGPGTWTGARAAVDVALTATDLVAGGERAAYACCRPPGHHATRAAAGGSCYLNNAAAAAARLRAALGGRVALLDLDAHHGNGSQSLFAGDDGVLTGSVHVDPAEGWFPHYVGFASESGPGNRNVVLAPGAGDDEWLEAVADLTAWAAGASGLVIALGVDAAETDPEAPLAVTPTGFGHAGQIVSALGLPTVVVQEGGYDLDAVGPLVCAFLEAF